MTPGQKAGWEYIRVLVKDLPITQRDVAEQFGVTEGTVRTNYQKILKDNGFGVGSEISAIKKLLKEKGP